MQHVIDRGYLPCTATGPPYAQLVLYVLLLTLRAMENAQDAHESSTITFEWTLRGIKSLFDAR